MVLRGVDVFASNEIAFSEEFYGIAQSESNKQLFCTHI